MFRVFRVQFDLVLFPHFQFHQYKMLRADMSVWRPLLVLLVAVVSSGKADECIKPVLSENLVLTDEAILKNEFPDGSVVTLECATGYVVDHGSDTITCTGGTWSHSELICKKKDCGLPEPLPNLTYNISDGTLFSAYIKPVCDRGYRLQGSSYRQCLARGWSGKPRCILITCMEPTEIPNGSMSIPSVRKPPNVGDVIEYSCDSSYKLIGNKTISCLDNGEYSADPPVCIPIECSAPYVQFGVQLKAASHYTHKSEAVFECQSGFQMKGSPTIICEEHGWSTLPVCIKATTTTSATTSISTTTTSATNSISTTTSTSATTSTTSPNFKNSSQSTDAFTATIIGIMCFILVALCCGIVFFVHHYKKRKGSYNTGEAQKTKEELLQKTSPSLTLI